MCLGAGTLALSVMAKGLEDTSFYRYHRLASLNEVGADPRSFGVSPATFHGACQEQALELVFTRTAPRPPAPSNVTLVGART